DKDRTFYFLTAGLIVIVRSPVGKQMWLRITIHRRIDLPPTFEGLQVRAATTDIPVLRERKNLIGADRRGPNGQEAVSAAVIHVLIRMSPAVGCPNCGRLTRPWRTPRPSRALSKKIL